MLKSFIDSDVLKQIQESHKPAIKKEINEDHSYIAENAGKIGGLAGWRTSDTEILVESVEDELYEVYDLQNILEEGAGNLGEFPDSIKKMATTEYPLTFAGENSEIINHGRAKSHNNLKSLIGDALKTGNTVTVHKNGQAIAAIKPKGNSYGREEYNVRDPLKNEKETTIVSKRNKFGVYKHTTNEFKKSEAVDRVAYSILNKNAAEGETIEDKDHFKKHTYEVKSISPDKERMKTHAERMKNSPELANNYVRATDKELEDTKLKNKIYVGHKLTSKTPTGSMKDIQQAAIDKKTQKDLANTPPSPYDKAKELHKQLGDAIEASDYKAAKSKAYELHNHISQNDVDKTSTDVNSYKSALQDVRKKQDWNGQAKKTIADLKAKYKKD